MIMYLKKMFLAFFATLSCMQLHAMMPYSPQQIVPATYPQCPAVCPINNFCFDQSSQQTNSACKNAANREFLETSLAQAIREGDIEKFHENFNGDGWQYLFRTFFEEPSDNYKAARAWRCLAYAVTFPENITGEIACEMSQEISDLCKSSKEMDMLKSCMSHFVQEVLGNAKYNGHDKVFWEIQRVYEPLKEHNLLLLKHHLIKAASDASVKDIAFILGRGVGVNAKDNSRLPVFVRAAFASHVRSDRDMNVCKLLISEGANVDVIIYGKPLLHYFILTGLDQASKLLIENGANINEQDDHGRTALMYAIKNEFYDIAGLLIERGANVNLREEWGITALHYAIFNKETELCRLLIAKGADVNTKTIIGASPLWYASRLGLDKLVKSLISEGADINAQDELGHTALQQAIEGVIDKGLSIKTCKLLISAMVKQCVPRCHIIAQIERALKRPLKEELFGHPVERAQQGPLRKELLDHLEEQELYSLRNPKYPDFRPGAPWERVLGLPSKASASDVNKKFKELEVIFHPELFDQHRGFWADYGIKTKEKAHDAFAKIIKARRKAFQKIKSPYTK